MEKQKQKIYTFLVDRFRLTGRHVGPYTGRRVSPNIWTRWMIWGSVTCEGWFPYNNQNQDKFTHVGLYSIFLCFKYGSLFLQHLLWYYCLVLFNKVLNLFCPWSTRCNNEGFTLLLLFLFIRNLIFKEKQEMKVLLQSVTQTHADEVTVVTSVN